MSEIEEGLGIVTRVVIGAVLIVLVMGGCTMHWNAQRTERLKFCMEQGNMPRTCAIMAGILVGGLEE